METPTPTPPPDEPAAAPLLEGHAYDGIREYDNPMPGWWTWLFVACIAWSPVYLLGVHVFGFFDTYEEKLMASQAELASVREAYAASAPSFPTDPRSLDEFASDPANAAAGAAIYATTCAACHGDQGQGLIGPNLTDDAWIHGGSAADIYTTISEGVVAAGMPAWDAQLSDEEQGQAMAFVVSIRGTNPPNPKPPQGDPNAE
jgi:cytochrome c oxidase cbb3-type subunit 3